MSPPPDPLQRFTELFALAVKAHPKDPNAMVLATVDEAGRPSARVVLMKGYDAEGFVFYTNTQSRKGRELTGQKIAALCFYWPELDQQVRVEGVVEQVSSGDADLYYASRVRGSQLGAWASQQSQPLPSRQLLEQRVAELDRQYADRPVPRPPYWTGFRVRPQRIEFWTARPNRLHDRVVYTREGDSWRTELLYP